MKKSTKTNQTSLFKRASMLLAMTLIIPVLAFAQPGVPTLSHPINNAENQPHSLNLLWILSSGADSYEVQVSKEQNFETTLFSKNAIPDSAIFLDELDFSTRYFWRVNATNDAGTSAFSEAFTFTTWDSIPKGPDPVDLGAIEDFAIFAYSAITNVPASAIKGNIGVSPNAGAFIGLSQGEVTGIMYAVDATGPAGTIASPVLLTEAKGDLTIAFNDAAGRTVSPVGLAGNLGGQTLYPGLYKSTGTLEISAEDLTLDAGGNTDAVWIFQIASSFNMTSGRMVFLTNGANAANVFWQVGTAATFGTTAVMKGTIMAGTQVTFGTGATLEGRALALNADVTLQQNAITLPTPTNTTSSDELDYSAPSEINLSQNFPNPFNPSTQIKFGLKEASAVRLEVFNMLGQQVATLVNEQKAAGWHTVTFDASALTSGMYMYRINANGQQISKQMMLIK